MNKTVNDFESLAKYDLFCEQREDIIMDLMDRSNTGPGSNFAKAQQKLEDFKQEERDRIR